MNNIKINHLIKKLNIKSLKKKNNNKVINNKKKIKNLNYILKAKEVIGVNLA